MIAGLLISLAFSATPEWRLIAAYDFAAVGSSTGEAPEFVWRPAKAMSKRCGPAKSPDGLGVFEAEAMSSGLSPTLAIVLEASSEDAAPLGPHNVAVAVGFTDAEERVRLQPSVMPRQLQIQITGKEETSRYQKLVRAQLDLEACMEHKTGRGWMGGRERQLKQAFMLVEPTPPWDPSRKYFGGQSDPVAALLGPPVTCLELARSTEADVQATDAETPTGRGESSMNLVATDIWGARLPECAELPQMIDPRRLQQTMPPLTLPLHLSPAAGESAEARLGWNWESIQAEVRLAGGTGPADERASVRLLHQVDGDADFEGPAEYRLECPLSEKLGEGEPPGLTDLLARLPYWYPEVEQGGPRRVVLLVPNWQLVEALRRLESVGLPGWDADAPVGEAGEGPYDAVGYLLSNPALLYVQVPPRGEVPGPYDRWAEGEGEVTGCSVYKRDVDGGSWASVQATSHGDQWLNLSASMALPVLGQPLGYSVGVLEGRSPVVLATRGDWPHVVQAQRSWFHAVDLGSFMVLIFVLLRGLLRISDLWTRAPEERADYWPGPGVVVVAETEANAVEADE